eukprot:15471228-Alexandrium_andersonii.AAC.1
MPLWSNGAVALECGGPSSTPAGSGRSHGHALRVGGGGRGPRVARQRPAATTGSTPGANGALGTHQSARGAARGLSWSATARRSSGRRTQGGRAA